MDSGELESDLKLGNQSRVPETMPFARVANRLINMLSTTAVWTGPEGCEMNEKFAMRLEMPDKILLTITVHDIK